MSNNTSQENKSRSCSDPFTAVREHKDVIEDIAAGSGPDAHVARLLLALERGEEPNPDDVIRLCDGPDQQE